MLLCCAAAQTAIGAEPPQWALRPEDTVVARVRAGLPQAASEGIRKSSETDLSPLGGGGFEAALINGFAAFLIDRAEREAALGFMVKLRDQLCKTSSGPELAPRKLFAETCELLDQMDDHFLQSANGSLPDLFRADLEALPGRLFDGLAESGEPHALELARLGRVLFEVGRRVRAGEHPAPAWVSTIDETVAWPGERSCVEHEIDYSLYALRSFLVVLQSEHGPLLKSKEIKAELGETLWTALLERLGKELALGCTPAQEKLATAASLKTPVADLIRRGEELERARAALEDARSKGQDVLRPGLTMLAAGFSLAQTAPAVIRIVQPKAAEAMTSLDRSLERAKVIASAAAERAYARVVVQCTAWVAELPVTVKIPPAFRRFAALAASLASAQSSEDMRAAFESAASPVGSFREKRGADGRVKLAVNSYVGVSCGFEILAPSPGLPDSLRGGTPAAGFFAPLGLEISTNFASEFPSSAGLFFSVLDFGALGQARLEDRVEGDLVVAQEPQLGFEQIFSPGLFVTLGVTRDAPFSLGVGAQLTPKLRALERVLAEDGQTTRVPVTEAPALRVHAFFALDLVIFAL
jgi:hypothetical protein